ncbi:MAG TPA: PilZ domain-containing protein [Candidatus Polarisedimenticolia bacterium]|nr:PilZ domain-containing protein [Candidatus Polarisedimenticolia bacterium]
MTNTFPPVRTEGRIPEEMLLELSSLESAAHEIASTVNVSHHGAKVLVKVPWEPNQNVSVRTVSGKLYSRAHVVYCKALPDRSFSIGLEFLQPVEDWLGLSKASEPPQTH